MTQNELNVKLNHFYQNKAVYRINGNYNTYNAIFGAYFQNNNIFDENETKKVIESLRFSCKKKEMLEHGTYGESHSISGGAIIKNKFFLIMIDNNILVFDLMSGNELKRYGILIDGKEKMSKNIEINMKKWINFEDNEFILIIKGNVILFELIEDGIEFVKLKIINYSFFLNYVTSYNNKKLKNLSGKGNEFYIIEEIKEMNYNNNYY